MKDDGEPSFKFGNCPKCKQDAALTWFIGKKKGTDQIVSGWMCRKCFDNFFRQDVS